MNDRIRVPEVRVIGAEGEQLGVLMIRRALDLAMESGLDLVEVAPTAKPPVCRIMDYAKYKYDQEKKERRIKRHQHISHLKQIRLKPHIGVHDYQVKMRQTIGFLEAKDKVKVNMMFRGREIAHKELGLQILQRVIVDVKEYGLPEQGVMMEGKIMYVVFNPVTAVVVEKGKEKVEANEPN
ncbi:MAG: translation initiation factor IF-3 [Candidatus Omnitrophica bacterium]|nr:translation initiation factor IF-3 [Candidatus Omnitrophota bacterium]